MCVSALAGLQTSTDPRAAGNKQVHRILIVDDHPDAANIMCMMSRALGHICVAAEGGRQAGFDHHVVKPASGAVLRQVLEHAETRIAAALSYS